MNNRLKSRINITDLILILIVLVLFTIILVICAKYFIKPKQNQNQNSPQTTVSQNNKNEYVVPKTEQDIIKNLSTMGERDRMNYYYGVFFKYLENKEYEAAYNILYPEFKEKYFPTLSEFEEYIKNTYPNECAWVDEDISRQGDIYVITIKIIDVLGSKESEKEQRIVIHENNYNDFVISFQVI